MARKGFSSEKIALILKEVELQAKQGKSIGEVVRSQGITEPTYYRWRQRYGGMEIGQLKQVKDLELENQRLRKAVADLTLDKQILEEALKVKL